MTDSSLPSEPPRPLAPLENVAKPAPPSGNDALVTMCDICGFTDVVEIRCKTICRNCRTILKTCSDL